MTNVQISTMAGEFELNGGKSGSIWALDSHTFEQGIDPDGDPYQHMQFVCNTARD